MKKIVIIGAGIAGLSAAVYARQSGFEVDVYEMHTLPGGECTGWNRQGYHIDNCIHWLTGTKPGTELYDIWQNVGAIDGVKLYTAEKYTVYKTGNIEVHMYTDVEKLRKHLKEISPQDSMQVDNYCNDILALQQIELPVKKPLSELNVLDYMKLGKKMFKGGRVMLKLSKISAQDYFSKFKHPVLREALGFGMNEVAAYIPLMTMAAISSGNGAYPMGGSLTMARRMAKKATDLGAKIHYKQEVKRIIVEKGVATGIVLADGKVIKGDYIVPANDLYVTMHKLLGGEYKDKKIDSVYSNPDKYKGTTTVSIGVGIACDLSHRIQDYVAPVTPFKILSKEIKKVSFKLHSHEKSFAPEGHSVMTIHLDGDYDEWKALAEDKKAYEEAKIEIEAKIKRVVEEVYEEAVGKIEMISIATPLTYERYCNAYKGAWMPFHTNKEAKGFEHSGIIKGVKNMYMAGQWLMPPGGLPVAVATGKWAIDRIRKQEKITHKNFK